MNVLLLAETSACRISGGSSRMVREQARALKKRGHTVCLLVRAPSRESEPKASFDGIPEYRYGANRSCSAAFVVSSIFRSTRVFDYICRNVFRPDVVVIDQSLAGFGPIFLRRKGAPTWIYQCFSLAHEEFLSRNAPGRSPMSRIWFHVHSEARRLIERLTIRRADRVVVMSEFMKKRVVSNHEVPGDFVTILPGAADTSRFKPAADKQSVRSSLGLPPDKAVLFTARNLVPRMGLENLVKAAAELNDGNPAFRLIIGGEGPLKASLEDMIRSLRLDGEVLLKGYVSEDDLVSYYQAADLVVMPTVALEGFGLVTVEALACGTPVVGTPVGATPEILTQIDSRLLTGGSDAGSIAKALRNIMMIMRNEPSEWRKIRGKCLEVVGKLYNWDKHGEALERALERSP